MSSFLFKIIILQLIINIMASFADKFLKDLEDLSADEHEEEEELKEDEQDADFAEYE